MRIRIGHCCVIYRFVEKRQHACNFPTALPVRRYLSRIKIEVTQEARRLAENCDFERLILIVLDVA